MSAVRRAPRAVELHIEELILHGFSGADRYRIGAAFERELARLLAEGAMPAALTSAGHIESLDAGSFPRSPHATPASIGGQAARAVYGGLGR
jgi:hypothetical protein